ncbi:MAG: GGDEF domain-containing protein [Roseburia sp.]|nr:GGDEF domain-containing protein [Roseburia sp.]
MEYTYEDKKAEAYLNQGEILFQEGRYAQTLEELSACLKCDISEEAVWIECRAYNILGDLFLFSGYETAAMENYLNAKRKAVDRKIVRQEVYAEIKIGLLYENMGGCEEALRHFDCAIEEARQVSNKIDYKILSEAYIQKAYILCKQGKFGEAGRVAAVADSIQKIHPEAALPLKYKLLLARLAKQSSDTDKLTACIQNLLQMIKQEKFSMEYCRFYLNVCEFLLDCSRKEEMKTLLEILKPVLMETEFISIARYYLKLQLSYDKRFSDKKTYQMTCGRYMSQNDSYAGRLLEFRQLNLRNLEELQRIRIERDKYQEKSRRDLTTGLLNKTAMEEDICDYLANRPSQARDALIILDIDNFKQVNDLHGHLVGDAVISRLSRVMKETYQKDELLGRFGGDEFVVFIKNIENLEDMERKLGTLKDKFCSTKFGKDNDLSCTISVGVSYNQEISMSYEALFECADQALYKAKEYGKNKIAFFEIKSGLLKYL